MRNPRIASLLALVLIGTLSSTPASALNLSPEAVLTGVIKGAGIDEDALGNIYVVDVTSNTRKVVMLPRRTGTYFGVSAQEGTAVTIVETSETLWGLAISPNQDIYATAQSGKLLVYPRHDGTYFGVSATANSWTEIASGPYAGGLEFDRDGNLLIAGGPGVGAYVLPASSGTLFGASRTANVISQISQVNTGWVYDLTVDLAGNLFVVNPWGVPPLGTYVLPAVTGTLYGQSVTAGTFTQLTPLSLMRPMGIDVDVNGNLIASGFGSTMVLTSQNTTLFGRDFTAGAAQSININIRDYVHISPTGFLYGTRSETDNGVMIGVYRLPFNLSGAQTYPLLVDGRVEVGRSPSATVTGLITNPGSSVLVGMPAAWDFTQAFYDANTWDVSPTFSNGKITCTFPTGEYVLTVNYTRNLSSNDLAECWVGGGLSGTFNGSNAATLALEIYLGTEVSITPGMAKFTFTSGFFGAPVAEGPAVYGVGTKQSWQGLDSGFNQLTVGPATPDPNPAQNVTIVEREVQRPISIKATSDAIVKDVVAGSIATCTAPTYSALADEIVFQATVSGTLIGTAIISSPKNSAAFSIPKDAAGNEFRCKVSAIRGEDVATTTTISVVAPAPQVVTQTTPELLLTSKGVPTVRTAVSTTTDGTTVRPAVVSKARQVVIYLRQANSGKVTSTVVAKLSASRMLKLVRIVSPTKATAVIVDYRDASGKVIGRSQHLIKQ